MWLLADMVSTGMMLAGVGLLIVILLRRSYRYYGRRKPASCRVDPHLTTTPRPAADNRSLSTAPPEVLRWQVEMHETARDLKAELDTKMRALQLLIRQARTESDRLQGLLDQLDASATQRELAQPHEQSATVTAIEQHQPRIYALADEGQSARAIADLIGVPLGEVEFVLSLRSPRSS
jgi:hypothetical protein